MSSSTVPCTTSCAATKWPPWLTPLLFNQWGGRHWKSRASVELKSCATPRAAAWGARDCMLSRLYACFIFAWLLVGLGWAQESKHFQMPTTAAEARSSLPDSPMPIDLPQDQRPPRIFWIIPTFKITESKTPTKLTPSQKLEIVVKDTIDPYTIGFTAFTAAIAQANNEPSGYGQGAAGYGKRFGASYADQASTGFFSSFPFCFPLARGSSLLPARFRAVAAAFRPCAHSSRGDLQGRGWPDIQLVRNSGQSCSQWARQHVLSRGGTRRRQNVFPLCHGYSF